MQLQWYREKKQNYLTFYYWLPGIFECMLLIPVPSRNIFNII